MIRDAALAAAVHQAFESAGLLLGVASYRRARQVQVLGGLTAPGNFALMVGLLTGAALGNKLIFLVEQPETWTLWQAGQWVWPGQSILGGLLGGLLGVELAKWITHQSRSTGDAMVWPIAMGLALGRVGCLLAGLHDNTYGLPTTLPWGVDFGDGLPRHPTQAYDALVALVLAAAVHARFPSVPGLAFKLFLSSYLAWRLLAEAIKPMPHAYALGLSGIQWTCVVALVAYAPFVIKAWKAHRSND